MPCAGIGGGFSLCIAVKSFGSESEGRCSAPTHPFSEPHPELCELRQSDRPSLVLLAFRYTCTVARPTYYLVLSLGACVPARTGL